MSVLKVPGDMARYDSAAVCRRGHVFTAHIERAAEVANRCVTCGAPILTECPACKERIRGLPSNVSGVYRPPSFCDRCGGAFPWATRQARIYELMNMLDEEELDAATELAVREQLDALAAADADDAEQEPRWERVRRLAPTFWAKSGAQQIITTLVLAEARARLGLPPA
jgi:hypothetical protein